MGCFEFELKTDDTLIPQVEEYAFYKVERLQAMFMELENVTLGINSEDITSHRIQMAGSFSGLPISYSYRGSCVRSGLREIFENLEFQLRECRKFLR